MKRRVLDPELTHRQHPKLVRHQADLPDAKLLSPYEKTPEAVRVV
jgi:hypothetical protein